MRTNRLSLLSSSIILLFCTACASQPERRGPPHGDRGSAGASYTGMAAKPIGLLFATMDADQDAMVDAAELDRGITIEWARLSNSDQATALDFEAWSLVAFGSKDTLPSFIAFDHDLDGRVSREGFSKHMRFEFDRLDADNSRSLARSELLFRVSRPSRAPGSEGQDKRSRGGGEGRGRPR